MTEEDPSVRAAWQIVRVVGIVGMGAWMLFQLAGLILGVWIVVHTLACVVTGGTDCGGGGGDTGETQSGLYDESTGR